MSKLFYIIKYRKNKLVQNAFKKHMCFFVLFFTLVAFFSRNFLKSAFLCFFFGQNFFFSVEPPVFS